MMDARSCHTIALVVLFLLLAGFPGCRAVPFLKSSQEIVLNGRRFVFEELDSIRPVGTKPFKQWTYDRGNFTIVTEENALLVNGVILHTMSDGVTIANQQVAVRDEEAVFFDSDMGWRVQAAPR